MNILKSEKLKVESQKDKLKVKTFALCPSLLTFDF